MLPEDDPRIPRRDDDLEVPHPRVVLGEQLLGARFDHRGVLVLAGEPPHRLDRLEQRQRDELDRTVERLAAQHVRAARALELRDPGQQVVAQEGLVGVGIRGLRAPAPKASDHDANLPAHRSSRAHWWRVNAQQVDDFPARAGS